MALLLPLLPVRRDQQPAHAAVVYDNGADAARRAAALRPGYGPPEASFPASFRGRWTVRCEIESIKTPQGEESAPKLQLDAARAAAASGPLVFQQRFFDDGGGGMILLNQDSSSISLVTRPLAGRVLPDRGFNAEQRSLAAAGASDPHLSAKWDPGNPNVLTLTSGGGGLTEVKIIKRLVEEPYDGTFGTSEYARYTATTAGGDLAKSPTVLAQRVQTKYKWRAEDSTADAGGSGAAVRTIEAIELAVLASGFGDPAGATPLLLVKSRLTFSKQPSA